jgi:hypothetical protein
MKLDKGRIGILLDFLLYPSVGPAQVTTVVVADPVSQGIPCTGNVLKKKLGFFTSTSVSSVIVGRGRYTPLWRMLRHPRVYLQCSLGNGISGDYAVSAINPNGTTRSAARPTSYLVTSGAAS